MNKILFNTDYENMIFQKTILTINKYIETNNVVVSFSGGKDSTVLLDICRRFINKNFKGVFNDTKIEYPEIVDFVTRFNNIDWIQPKTTFFSVIKKYGLPIISKEQSRYISDIFNPNVCKKLKDIRLSNKNFSVSKKWRYLFKYIKRGDFKISDKCCYHLKKAPLKKYAVENKVKYLTGERITESNLRKRRYHTCILPDKCIPLRLWTDSMIAQYIKFYDIPISKIYETENRTGCMFCMYGYQRESQNNNRFTRMKKYHPKFYNAGCKVFDLENILKIIDLSRNIK